MSPGLALLVGVLIGAAVVYFVMQARLQERVAVSQGSQNRADRLSEQHQQELNVRLAEQRSQLEADCEQRLTVKVEQYQNEHAQQLAALEAEYEARLNALRTPGTPSTSTRASTSASPAIATGTVLGATAGAAVLPDPWESSSAVSAPAPAAAPPQTDTVTESNIVEKSDSPELSDPAPMPPLPSTAAKPVPVHTEAQALGAAAAISPKETAQALPRLGKLSKDPDPTVRLAAVQALQQSGSAKAVPLLKQALRDPDGDVVAAASAALSRFKGMPRPKPQKAKKKRPKNR